MLFQKIGLKNGDVSEDLMARPRPVYPSPRHQLREILLRIRQMVGLRSIVNEIRRNKHSFRVACK